jgi:hypothetical protein
MGITPTTVAQLETLFIDRIRETTPAVTFGDDAGWKHYRRSADAATTSRRFTLRWDPGRHVRGGIWTNAVVELEATLRVRTDYAAGHEYNSEMIQSDWSQLRFELSQLSQDQANGLILVLQTTSPPTQVADNNHARQRVSAQGIPSSDTVQVDLTYQVRYLKAS